MITAGAIHVRRRDAALVRPRAFAFDIFPAPRLVPLPLGSSRYFVTTVYIVCAWPCVQVIGVRQLADRVARRGEESRPIYAIKRAGNASDPSE